MAESRRRYRDATRRTDGNWTKYSNHDSLQNQIEDARKALRQHGGQDGPYRLRVNEGHGFDDFGVERDLDGTVHRIREILPKINVGDLLDADLSPHNTSLLRIKPVRIEAHKDPVPKGYNPRVTNCLRFYNSRFPGWENWGICNKRVVAGTSTWSQHSYANAIDLHFDSMGQMDDVARAVKNNWGQLDIAWMGWRVANHYDHVHVDFNPQSPGGFCA